MDEQSMSRMSTDTQMEVFSFLDLDSLRCMMATSRSFRRLLASDAAYRLWLFQLELCWGKLPQDLTEHSLVLQNDVTSVPFAEASSDAFERLGNTNLPLLLAMKPEQIGKHLLLYFYRPGVVFDVSPSQRGSHLEYSSEFTNHVYSVRASRPLAKPKVEQLEIIPPQKDEMMIGMDCDDDIDSDKAIGHRLEQEAEYTYKWRPFVMPYRCHQSSNESGGPPPCIINISPRLVSYYEVSIETRDWENAPVFRDDCVCIGLSTSRSRWISRLPGWDKLSYGYHGDNGGLYHGSGRNIGLVGTFGLGDTVGMGVDYVNRHIFVTKNGRFVTIAFHNLNEKMLSRTHLLPVVGLYTRHAVRVNYGGLAEPFRFDLASYCSHDQKQLALSAGQVPSEIEYSI